MHIQVSLVWWWLSNSTYLPLVNITKLFDKLTHVKLQISTQEHILSVAHSYLT